MSQSTVSVLFSIYEKEKPHYLREMLKSIQVQTYKPIEILCVIDGPITSDLNSTLEDFKFLNIRYVKLSENMGLGFALNRGLKCCRADYVCRIDTDDIMFPDRIEKQVKLLDKNPDIDICGSLAYEIDDQGHKLKTRKVPEYNDSIKKLIWSCPIIHPSVMYRKRKLLKVGNYSISIPRRQEDYELWIRSATNGLVFYNIQESLIYYRVYPNEPSKNNFNVGLDRLKIGFPAVREFDPRLFSFLAVLYPVFRGFLPNRLNRIIARFFDPR